MQLPNAAHQLESPQAGALDRLDELANWAAVCEALAVTTKKLEKRAILAAYLAPLPVADAARAALYVAGQPFPETDRRQLNVGNSLLLRALAERTGAAAPAIALAVRRHGDIGSASQELLQHAAPPTQPPLNLADLEALLGELAAARGPAARLRLVSPALARASAIVCKYILKLLAGDMRIGVKQSLVEEAIAVAYRRELQAVRHAAMLLGSLPAVITHAAADTLQQAAMRLFHPLGFMLASPVDSVDQAMARFANAQQQAEVRIENAPPKILTAPITETIPDADPKVISGPPVDLLEPLVRMVQLEDKYDGIRAQLHAGDPANPGRVGLFSRGNEDLSAAFPDLIEACASLPEAVILDGEILAWNPSAAIAPATATDTVADSTPAAAIAARALPFSSLQQRLGRKQVSADLRASVPVIFMAFDLLYADGELWLHRPLAERRTRLEQHISRHAAAAIPQSATPDSQHLLFAPAPSVHVNSEQIFPRLLLAPALRLQSAAQLDAAYSEARARGNEGVMLKTLDSVYQPGRRGMAWLKLKRELATLDVVVTGAEFGSGRRAGYLSDYTFAVRDADGTLQNIGKAYSGVTDLEMHALSAHFEAHTLEDFGHFRTVEPDTIFEVAFNNITRSSRHSSGYALRFPRILRIRTEPGKPEKPISEIDTLARVAELYTQQPDKPIDGERTTDQAE
jgi:DNA ligase-1